MAETTISEYEVLAKQYRENKVRNVITPSGAEFKIRRMETQELGIILNSEEGATLEDEVLKLYNQNKYGGEENPEKAVTDSLTKTVVKNVTDLENIELQSNVVSLCAVSPPVRLVDGVACIGPTPIEGDDLTFLFFRIMHMSGSSFIQKKK